MSRGCGLEEEDLDDIVRWKNVDTTSLTGCSQGDISGETCSGGACRDEGQGCSHQGSWSRASDAAHQGTPVHGASREVALCMKCKSSTARVLVRQRERLCAECLRSGILGKVRSAVKFKGLIERGDKVLLALSGSPASLATLYCIRQLQNTDPKREERGKVYFDLGVVHVDTGVMDESTSSKHQEDMDTAARSTGFLGEVSYLHLHEVFQRAVPDTRLVLDNLLASIPDKTGREDMITYLRSCLIQHHACAHGYTKIVKGVSASGMAIRVIADVAKGRGFSLPADIQLVDARQGPGSPVVLYPMKDLTDKELAYLCTFSGIKLPTPLCKSPVAADSKASINHLAKSFINSLQQNLPSAIFTVLGTTSHLQPFPWNAPPPPLRRRARQTTTGEGLKGSNSGPGEQFGTNLDGVMDGEGIDALSLSHCDNTGEAEAGVTPGVIRSQDMGTNRIDDAMDQTPCPPCSGCALCIVCSSPCPNESATAQTRPTCHSCAHQIVRHLGPTPFLEILEAANRGRSHETHPPLLPNVPEMSKRGGCLPTE